MVTFTGDIDQQAFRNIHVPASAAGVASTDRKIASSRYILGHATSFARAAPEPAIVFTLGDLRQRGDTTWHFGKAHGPAEQGLQEAKDSMWFRHVGVSQMCRGRSIESLFQCKLGLV